MDKFKLSSGFWLILFTLLMPSCYVSKPLESDVRVDLDENVPIKITKDDDATFITFFGEDDYRKSFLEGMKSSLGYDKIVIDHANPQFRISISEFDLNERTTTDTVKDQKSKDNGKIFDIAVATLKVNGLITNLSDQKSVPWTADKDKREKITSLQSLGQMMSGENKNLTEYRKKDFDKNEFITLSSECGRRAATVITNSIRRQMK